jgi:hypothetical protein
MFAEFIGQFGRTRSLKELAVKDRFRCQQKESRPLCLPPRQGLFNAS